VIFAHRFRDGGFASLDLPQGRSRIRIRVIFLIGPVAPAPEGVLPGQYPYSLLSILVSLPSSSVVLSMVPLDLYLADELSAVFVAFVYNIIGVKFFDAGGAEAVAEIRFGVIPDIGLDLIPNSLCRLVFFCRKHKWAAIR
jgi:hypothetical protein